MDICVPFLKTPRLFIYIYKKSTLSWRISDLGPTLFLTLYQKEAKGAKLQNDNSSVEGSAGKGLLTPSISHLQNFLCQLPPESITSHFRQ